MSVLDVYLVLGLLAVVSVVLLVTLCLSARSQGLPLMQLLFGVGFVWCILVSPAIFMVIPDTAAQLLYARGYQPAQEFSVHDAFSVIFSTEKGLEKMARQSKKIESAHRVVMTADSYRIEQVGKIYQITSVDGYWDSPRKVKDIYAHARLEHKNIATKEKAKQLFTSKVGGTFGDQLALHVFGEADVHVILMRLAGLLFLWLFSVIASEGILVLVRERFYV